MRPILVIGASGTIGSEVVSSLLQRRAQVRVLVRSLDRVANLPASVERVVGSAAVPSDLARAVEGAESVFHVSAHAPDESEQTLNVIRVCEQSGARLVFVGVHWDGRNRLSRFLGRAIVGRLLPQYRSKFRSSERVRQSCARTIVLAPTNFFQNDELFKEEILSGTFPQPLGHYGANRIDTRDVGEIAANVLLEPATPPGAYVLQGDASLTGPECAAIWSQALGREVRYTGDGTEWRRILGERLDGQKRSDFLATYSAIPKFKIPTNPKAVAATTRLLGRAPRTYAEYARDMIERWRKHPGRERARLG